MEIAEDEEEENKAKRQSTVQEERPPTAKGPSVSGASISPSSPAHAPGSALPHLSPVGDAEELRETREPRGSESQSLSPTKTIDESEPRKSSQSTRPELSKYTSFGSNGKPKVKLGPRPSLDVGGRPHTSGAASHYRPVSTLPAGLKLFSKGSKGGKERPKSQYTTEMPSMMISPPPIPDATGQSAQIALARPHTSGGRPTTSSGASIKMSVATSTNTPKTPTITPEKARLMKAMQLRKKQMSAITTTTIEAPAPNLDHPSTSPPPADVNATLAILTDMEKEDDKEGDSGIAFDASSAIKTDESDATRSDSNPVSPVGPSEPAESTRASSISESTDETVQEAQTSKNNPIVDADVTDDTKKSPLTSEQPDPQECVPSTTIPIDDLPRLLPVTYQPPSSPLVVSQIYKEELEAASKSLSDENRPGSKATEEASTTAPEYENPPISAVEKAESNVQEFPEATVSIIGSETESQAEQAAVPGKPPISAVDRRESLPEHALEATVKENEELISSIEDTPTPSSPVKVEIKEWKVPRSKFSVQDLKAAAETPVVPTEPLPAPTIQILPKSPVDSNFSLNTNGSNTEDELENGKTTRRKKRRAMVEPIRTDIELTDRSGANSEANFSSDDDLMDELQSAVFQEAKPISVSKSPLSPVFPNTSPEKRESSRFSRAFSNPLRKDGTDSQMLTPPSLSKADSTRSVSASAAYLNRINQQTAKPIAKKVNLGSSISQRIKALEKSSNLAPEATPPAPSPATSATFFSVRKGSVRGAKSPSIAERATSLTRNTPSPSPPQSAESSPETLKLRNRSGSVQSRLSAFISGPSPAPREQPPAHKSRPESISVTARIIRDPNQPFPTMSEAGKDPSEYTPLDLKQSPLVIDHQRAVTTPTKETIQERRLSNSSKASKTTTTTNKERRSSITVVRDLFTQGRTSFAENRRSITLERPSGSPTSILSPVRPPSTHTNKSPGIKRTPSFGSRKSSRDLGGSLSPPPTAGSASSASASDEKADKKSNLTSRMMRRMSSSLSSSRKTLAQAMSPSVREESEPPIDGSPSLHSSQPSQSSPIPSSVNIGDVNVQFPDTLLWKRRSMLLDSQGYLIMTPALTASGNPKDKTNVGATRRFHLGEFRTPVIPDADMQELPNSVILDFVEGGGLQIACEDRGGQARILNSRLPNHFPLGNHTDNCDSPSRITSLLGCLWAMTPQRNTLFFLSHIYDFIVCPYSAFFYKDLFIGTISRFYDDAWRPRACLHLEEKLR
jgi:hypothetical protein